MSERVLYSKEAEQSLIGSLMMNNKIVDDVICEIQAEDFYFPEHQEIYKAILGMNGKRFDQVILAERSTSEMVSLDYLVEISKSTPSWNNAMIYAEKVKERKIERDLFDCGQEIQEICKDNSITHQQRVEASQIAFTATSSERQADTQVEIKKSLGIVLESLDRRLEGKEDLRNIKTGYKDLDERLGGYRPGNLIIVGSKPGMGKTTFATGVAKHSASNYGKTMIFSLEMPHVELTQRLIACCGRVGMDVLRDPKKATDSDWAKVAAGSSVIMQLPIIIDDQGGLSIVELAARARREHRKEPLKLIIIDYLQLMNSGNRNHKDNRNLEIGAISMGLKNLAKELDCPVIALSQLNRKVEERPNKRPIMPDLRDSGSIEQDADIIHFLYRDELYDEDSPNRGILEINTAKFRDGVIGTDYLCFQGRYNAIDDLVPGQQFQQEEKKTKRRYG